MDEFRNEIICGDCVEVLGKAEQPFADLIFADPPFNIGYKYDRYNDKRARKDYLDWTQDWIAACIKVLKPHGSFYIAIGDKYAAEIKIAAEKLGLRLRNWIIWHYSFGQQMRAKYSLSHTHIFYFVVNERDFVFNDDAVRVISDRQKKYADKRANPAGKMPDDVWDEYPRVCGTFTERTGFPCQMPESLLARIIRLSSNPGDWVLDPFSGSGTTAVVAHKLGRVYTGIELSEEYRRATVERIAGSEGLPVEGEGRPQWPDHADDELRWLYQENKLPVEQLSKHPMLLALFTSKLNSRLDKIQLHTPAEVLSRLRLLDRSGRLTPLVQYKSI